MKKNYKEAINFVFRHEGGYANHPKDPGGATMYGITIHDARKYWKYDATPSDMKRLPKEIAADIYYKHYATPIHFDSIAPGLDLCTLDAAVNSGVGRADKWLAHAIQSKSQGYKALAADSTKVSDLVAAIKRYQAKRLSFVQGLKNWKVFGAGWGRRIAEGEALAIKMALGAKIKPAGEIKREIGTQVAEATAKRTGGLLIGSGALLGAVGTWWTELSNPTKVVIVMALTGLTVFAGRQALKHYYRVKALKKQISK